MASNPLDWVDLLKVAIPALGAWGATVLSNRRERHIWTEKQEEKQQALLASSQDRLVGSWAEMTSQAREMISRLQIETIDAKTRAATAEERLASLKIASEERFANLKQELEDVQQKYAAALRELEELRERGKRVRPSEGD